MSEYFGKLERPNFLLRILTQAGLLNSSLRESSLWNEQGSFS